MKKKVVAVIQARMGSTRLPGKVLMHICDKPILEHVVTRVLNANEIDDVVIATTMNSQDDLLEEYCLEKGYKVFRGSENNVLSRFYGAAKAYKSDAIVRITADCPLIDYQILDEMVKVYRNNNQFFVTNAGPDDEKRTYPRGFDVEIIGFGFLEEAYENATDGYELEHVTPYLYEHHEMIYHHINDVDYSKYRLTVDTEEDFMAISQIYKNLYHGIHDFALKDIVELMEKNPEISELNNHIEQKRY